MSLSPKDPTLPVDDEARALARQLLRTARSGALATNDWRQRHAVRQPRGAWPPRSMARRSS